MTTFYKCTRPDGTDFRTGTVNYAAALASGEIIRHPAALKIRNQPKTYLSVSVAPADCTGMKWPCRLFRVEPVGKVMGAGKTPLKASPNKRAVSALRVVEELPAWQALGPNGEAVASLIARCRAATDEEILSLSATWWHDSWSAARNAAWYAAQGAARGAARDAVWDAVWDAAWNAPAQGAAWDAAQALVVRDLITPEQFDILCGSWRSVMETA